MSIRNQKKLPKIIRKSLLYQTNVEYGYFCMNNIEGCSNGSNYPCYAMMMKIRYGMIKNYRDWIKPKIVGNTMELLEKEIPRYKDKINFVHLCFSTDPFMYGQKEVRDLTLKVIKRLNQDNIRCSILTKGIYPRELTDIEKYSKENIYGITIVSLDKNFKRKFETFSSPFESRVKSLKYLHNEGLKTWVSMEPYPTPNLVSQDLSKILEKISFVDKIVFGKLNYNVRSSQFKDSKNFYQKRANEVVKFCEDKNIECHIKYGTQRRDNRKTENIFKATPQDLEIIYVEEPSLLM